MIFPDVAAQKKITHARSCRRPRSEARNAHGVHQTFQHRPARVVHSIEYSETRRFGAHLLPRTGGNGKGHHRANRQNGRRGFRRSVGVCSATTPRSIGGRPIT